MPSATVTPETLSGGCNNENEISSESGASAFFESCTHRERAGSLSLCVYFAVMCTKCTTCFAVDTIYACFAISREI